MQVTELTQSSGILLKVIQYYGIKQSQNRKYLCPFHKENTASFMTYKDSTKYKCFGCGEQGDSIDFIQKIENMSFKEASEKLANISGNFINSDKKAPVLPNVSESPVKKIHIRKIGDFDKDNRFIRIPKEDIIIRDVSAYDKPEIDRMNKKLTLDNIKSMSVKISEIPYGFAFPDENDHNQLIYNPEKKDISLHLEGRTDWMTAGELDLQKHFSLISEHNKTSKIFLEPGTEHVFILDSDDSEDQKIKCIKSDLKNNKVKFVGLPKDYKDLSDLYALGNYDINRILSLINSVNYYKPEIESDVIEVDGSYYIKLSKGNLKRITNFTMELVCRYSTEVEKNNSVSMRQVRLKYKNKVKIKNLTDTQWVDFNKFRIALAGEGEFNFIGNKNDFEIFRMYMIEKYPDREIIAPVHLGKIDDDTWLFENGVMVKNEFYRNNEEKITYIKSEVGYAVIEQDDTLKINATEIDMKKTFLDFYQLYGDIAYKMIGYSIASLFKDKITDKFGCFPLMFFSGKSESGKSRASDLMASLVGCGALQPFNYSSTSKGLYRYLERYKNLIVRINEYNSSDDKQDQFLMSLYDNEGYIRARTDNTLKTIKTEVNSGVIVMSEVLPNREAVINRTINCNFNNVEKQSGLFNDLYTRKDELSNFLLQIVSRMDFREINRSINTLREELYRQLPGCERRIIDNYSIIFGALLEFFRVFGFEESVNPFHYNCISEIKERIKKDVLKVKELSRDTSSINIFFDHLKFLHEKKTLSSYLYVHNESLIINLRQCYYAVKENDNKTSKEIRMSKNDVKVYIEEAFHVKYSKSLYRPSDQSKTGGYKIPLTELEKIGVYFNE
jgi:hypothetical protein